MTQAKNELCSISVRIAIKRISSNDIAEYRHPATINNSREQWKFLRIKLSSFDAIPFDPKQHAILIHRTAGCYYSSRNRQLLLIVLNVCRKTILMMNIDGLLLLLLRKNTMKDIKCHVAGHLVQPQFGT